MCKAIINQLQSMSIATMRVNQSFAVKNYGVSCLTSINWAIFQGRLNSTKPLQGSSAGPALRRVAVYRQGLHLPC